MKKISLLVALAGLFVFAGCNNGSKASSDPTFTWDSNSKFAEMEIGKNMDGVISVSIPGGLTAFTVTATIPNKLVGMAEQLISISSNKANESQLVFDFIQDAKTVSSLKSFASVTAGTKGFKMDFSKFLDALIGTADVANASRFVFKLHVEDAAGLKKDCQVSFKWTSAPSFTVSGKSTYELGSKEDLVVKITAPGKVEKLTLTFAGSTEALDYLRKRIGNSNSAEIAGNATYAEALGFKNLNIANQTAVNLDFKDLIDDLTYEVTKASTTTVTIKVDDALGKSGEQVITFVKK